MFFNKIFNVTNNGVIWGKTGGGDNGVVEDGDDENNAVGDVFGTK